MRIEGGAGPVAAAMLVLMSTLSLTALAGDENLPEIKDGSGDSASGKNAHDVLSAWFHDETNDTIDITLHTESLELYTDPSELPNLPTYEYEVYFTIGETSYAVVCRVPVHGPFGITIQFGLNSVQYSDGNESEEPVEESMGTLNECSYNPGNSTIHWVLPKLSVGSPEAGTHLTGTWAGVWSRNFSETARRLEDRAPNSGYGLDYIVRGATGGEVLRLEMSVDNATGTCRPNEPAVYRLTLLNNGTTGLNVEMVNSTMPEGWNCTFSLDTLHILNGSSRIITVYIYCPRSARNGTVETTTVTANIQSSDNISGPPASVTLTTVVFYLPPRALDMPNPLLKLLNALRSNPLYLYSIIGLVALVAVASAAGAAVRHRRKKKAVRAEARSV
ncbi:MAG: COG1470 family protein [Thermoplasmatota archaeon]